MRPVIPIMIAALVGCVDGEDSTLPDDPEVVSRVVSFEYIDAPHINAGVQLDVLIIVDTSPAIAPYRDRLVASYRRFGDALMYGDDDGRLLPDLHLGVVTADLGGEGCGLGDGAAFRHVPQVAGDFVIDTPVTSTQRSINYGGELGAAIAALADAGSAGCAVQRPIDAMKLVLGGTTGFRRPDAYLAVVFVSASDDASTLSIEAAGDLLASLVGGPSGRVTVGVIGGPATATCGVPATRLRALAQRFPDRNTFASICGNQHDAVIAAIDDTYMRSLAQPCLESVATPIECAVEDEYPGSPAEALAACDAGATNRPCWYFRTVEWACIDGLELHVARASGPVAHTVTRGQCVATP